MTEPRPDRPAESGGSFDPPHRIAWFGGSFDPPHRGHLAVARAAADRFQLDRVLFAPAGRQPLKKTGAHASFGDRLAMTELLCQADPRFRASAVDAPRPDGQPNYTVDTLARLREQHPGDRLFAIAGADSFLDLPRWHDAARLFDLAEWVVASRPGFPLDRIDRLGLTPAQRSRVHLLPSVEEPVSATELRQRLAAGDPCPGLIPEAVGRFLQQHQLYRQFV